ncbi:hypothetical protein Dimus_015995 [Dionaea muscipula]
MRKQKFRGKNKLREKLRKFQHQFLISRRRKQQQESTPRVLQAAYLIHFYSTFAQSDHARAERLQAELDNARVKNARLQELLQQATSHPKP